MTLTKPEIYEKLGLMQPEDYFNNVAWKNPKERIERMTKTFGKNNLNSWALDEIFYARTGRTTAMQVEVLQQIYLGYKVFIKGYSENFTKRLNIELRRFAQKLQLNTELIVDSEQLADKVFTDHWHPYYDTLRN